MSFLYTEREENVKTHTVSQAVEIYKQIQFDNGHPLDLSVEAQLNARLTKDPHEKITMKELNELVADARKCRSNRTR